ncbi:hypothetical protein GCM10010429_39980 [Micromonospora olivasterospora]|uniref:hypothetical protein n=1 Tax=Micromonospora olivasterospora TaxID=1880 RepID=UPI0031D42FA5
MENSSRPTSPAEPATGPADRTARRTSGPAHSAGPGAGLGPVAKAVAGAARAGVPPAGQAVVPPTAGAAGPVATRRADTPAARADATPDPGMAGADPADIDAADRACGGRRRAVRIALGVDAVASAAGLTAGLLTWAPTEPEPSRPLTGAEAQRFAAVRVTNQRDVRSGLRLTLGDASARLDLVGWIDWSRSLAYVDVGGPGAGPDRGLVQATPRLLLARPDPAAVPAPAPPPLVPPADGWRVPAPSARALRPALDLLFALAAPRPEPPGSLPEGDGRWLGRAEAGGQPVDILQAPLPGGGADRRDTDNPGTATPAPTWPGPVASLPAAAAPSGVTRPLDGPARWWIDRDARLHRLEGRLPGGVPVILELQRTNRPTLWPVPALGGRPGLPRALTGPEEDRLARLPARLRADGGAAVTLTAPVAPGATPHGTGWVSWTARAAYLAVGDPAAPDGRTLRRYDPGGLWVTPSPGDPVAGPPPLPPPRAAWQWRPPATDDVDALLAAALRAGEAAASPASASRVRGDRAAGRTVDVVEVNTRQGRVRYWIDRDGVLRRLELRTRLGTYAQLDLDPGRTPALPPVAPPAPPPPTR